MDSKNPDIVHPYLGFKPNVKTATYFTDASALKIAYDNPPIIILGPGESAMAHKTDEYCLIDKIPESSSILKDIIITGIMDNLYKEYKYKIFSKLNNDLILENLLKLIFFVEINERKKRGSIGVDESKYLIKIINKSKELKKI